MSGAARIEVIDVVVSLAQFEDKDSWLKIAGRKLKCHPSSIEEVRLIKQSIDARKSPVKMQLRLEVGVCMPLPPEEEVTKWQFTTEPVTDESPRAIIVGAGPCGLFAALELLQLGIKPIILERGKDASSRRFDLAPIMREGRVIEESNYCFGEGGAGTFSDGKLYTRAKKRGSVALIYQILVAHGAPENILTEAHPHIGSNLLPKVVMAIRESIKAQGGEVHFGQKVVDFVLEPQDNGQQRCTGVKTQLRADAKEEDYANGQTHDDFYLWEADSVILATGHSARDIYYLLNDKGVALEKKSFAMGVRIEHPQAFIDKLQYHLKGDEKRSSVLPASRYSLATKLDNRGIHSFCMCPGGFVVPAATENDEVVVNGMSLSRRDSYFANSGMVVTVLPEDTIPYGDGPDDVLAGIKMQKQVERNASMAGGGKQKAPAQRLVDFMEGKVSETLPKTSYFPGLTSCDLNELITTKISGLLKEGFKKFNQQMRGYICEDALLIGFETRTSSPVKIPRDPMTLEHPEVRGLYPAGEGAGFAGGIISAAMDGINIAHKIN